jgi:hypothetical protein
VVSQDKPPDHNSYHEALTTEASTASHAQITQDTVPIITLQITKETMEAPTGIDPLIKEETHSIIPQMHLKAGTITPFQWI